MRLAEATAVTTAASSSDSGSSTIGTASTQPSAILRLPLIDAAALTMHVPSTPRVTAAKPSARPAGIRIFVRSSPAPTAVM